MEIICYGCGRGQYTENTLKAIECCHLINPDWRIEMDIQLTRDHEIVLFHDENMSHLCGVDASISDLSWKELEQVVIHQPNLEQPELWKESDRRIPRIVDILAQTKHDKFIIDISTSDGQIVPILKDILSPYKGKKEFIIVSMFDRHILAAKKFMPWLKLGAGASEAKGLVFSSKLCLNRFFDVRSDILLIPEHLGKIKLLSQRLVDHVHNRGKKIYVWKQEKPFATCYNERSELKRLEFMGVDGIFTDRPEELLMSLRQRK